MVVHTCNPSTQEAEWQEDQKLILGFIARPFQKKKKERKKEVNEWGWKYSSVVKNCLTCEVLGSNPTP
jgi:hypothetical protein